MGWTSFRRTILFFLLFNEKLQAILLTSERHSPHHKHLLDRRPHQKRECIHAHILRILHVGTNAQEELDEICHVLADERRVLYNI